MELSPDKPLAGILAPLFAIRAEHDLGAGDTECLRQFADWAADAGFGLVQLLPVNEMGSDNSPYNAISSVAIEPATLFLSPKTVPGLTAVALKRITKRERNKTGDGPVNWARLRKLIGASLESAFRNFFTNQIRGNSAQAKKFEAFESREAAWLDGYALFRALMDTHHTECWDRWPEEVRTLAVARDWLAAQPLKKRRAVEKRVRFFKYVQWVAFTQWRALKAHCDARGVALMGDVPVGVSYYSADVWSQPELFDLNWSGGAPPEPYFKDDAFVVKWGQNWGVPLYRWEAMRTDNFAWWRQRVGKVREFFHLFRIDHVLGFYRIYGFPWRPERNTEFLPLTHDEARLRTGGELPRYVPRDDSSQENKDANCGDGEERLRALSEVVGEHRLIAEDLGAVPDYVRPSLASLGIPGFKIPMWEREWDGRLTPGGDYPRLSVATYATHDHESLRALWENWTRESRAGNQQALDELWRLCDFAGLRVALPCDWSDAIHEALLGGLFRSNSWLAVCMITDLLGGTQRFNVPGAVGENNWTSRLPHTVGALRADPALREKMERISAILRETGRARDSLRVSIA